MNSGKLGEGKGMRQRSKKVAVVGGSVCALALLIGSLARDSFAAGDQDPTVEASTSEVLEGVLQNVPCHLLRSRRSYVFPDYMMMASDDRHLSGHPVDGLRWDTAAWSNGNGPDGMQSVEYQTYLDGRGKLIVVPYRDEDDTNAPGRVSAWVVYTAHRDAKVLGYWDSRGRAATDQANQAIDYGVVTDPDKRRLYRGAREKESYNFLPTWRTQGAQTPYKTTMFERDVNVPTSENEVVYQHRLTTELYVQEVCVPVGVWTPEKIQSEIVPAAAWSGCANANYADSTSAPRCLADHYLADERKLDSWARLVRTAAIVPLLGTTLKVVDCLDTGDAYCWGEAAVSGVTDLATLFVPVAKAATGSGITQVAATGKKLSALGRPMMGLAITGQTGLGLVDAADGNILAAMSRFVAAGAFVIQLRSMPSGNGRISSFRRVRGQTRDLTPNCATPEATATSRSCSAGACRSCALRDPFPRPRQFRSLVADAGEWQLGAPYNAHPIRVTVGDELYRGLASRHVELPDAVRWVAGVDDSVFLSHKAGLSFRSQLADGSLAARREAFESVAPQIGTEIRAEVEAATSTLGSQPSHQLFAWAQRQQQLTHHAGGATGTIDDAYGIAFTADRKLAVGYADSLSVPSTRPRYMLHVKARDSGYIGERLGTTQQLEAYRMGFVPSDDAVALYTRPTEQSAWFKLQRHDSCSIEVMLATGDDLAQTQSLGLVSKQNLSADIAALRAQHADLGAVADAIETAMTVDTP